MNENKKANSIEEIIKLNDLIKLYPFNGRSTSLIDKFYIIGYDYLTLQKLLKDNIPKCIQDNKDRELRELHKFNIDEEPNILNEFTSDYKKVGLPNETILKMIYPKNADFYYIPEEYTNFLRRTGKESAHLIDEYKKVEFNKDLNPMHPKSYLVVFSSNPQAENNSKKSINGLAYTFYSRFKEVQVLDKKKYTFYIPYTFCIISEYPFFNSFYKLMKYIKKLYSQEIIYIPIEIIIYNIVTLSPSPLNCDVKLNLKSSFENKEYKKVVSNAVFTNNRHYKNVESFTSVSNTINEDKNINTVSSEFVIINDDSFSSKSNKQKNLKRYNTQYVKTKNEVDNDKKEDDYTIRFSFLSGYPLIQYNLSKVLFYSLIPEKVITIFLYTFLEKDVIFFSKDIEYLTFTLNAYLNLNYPLNDEKYYFIGAPISFEDFVNGNSEFGLKNYTSIIGINDQYKPSYKNKNLKIADHLVVDLDKPEIYEGNDENDNRVNYNNKKIMDLVKKICRNSDDERIKKTILYRAIKKLNHRLTKVLKKIELLNDKKNITKINFIEYNDDSNIEENNMPSNQININNLNREIQEAFYEFINNICIYFYENLKVKTKQDELKNRDEKNEGSKDQSSIMNVIFNKIQKKESVEKYIEEEIIFLDELSDTMKFQSFVFGFLQYYNPIDLYKIPLTFTEEFLSILSRKRDKANIEMEFFNLFDSFYNTGKKDEKELNFNIVNFNYFKYYKSIFDREITDKSKCKYLNQKNYDHLVKCISENSFELTKYDAYRTALIYQTYELDDNILLKYIHITNNLNKTDYLGQFFESIFIEENSLKQIRTYEIETKIEKYCINKKVLTNNDICCANIILLFALSLKSLRNNMDCTTFLCLLFQDFIVFRKYYGILLRMIYKLYQDAFSKKTYSKCKNSNLCYFPCINSIRAKLVPNEDLLKIINQFNILNIENMVYPEDEKKEEIIIDEKLKDIKLYGEQLKEEEISNENLYIFHNFTPDKFINEKDIVDIVNDQGNKNFKASILEGHEGYSFVPKIRFNNGIHKIESLFFSQKQLLDYLIIEYNNYIVDLDEKKLKTEIILDACLNILIFIRNSEKFEEKDDIKEAVKNIFYSFMNQLYILNSIKSNNN